MIKKNTKVIYRENGQERTEDLIGGIPLAKGEIVHFHDNDKTKSYLVIEKKIDCYVSGEDQVVDIIYTLDLMV